jgi:hypothetical protein
MERTENPVPEKAWSNKRERQYKHIKASERERGVGKDRAEEIAARTVNKNRAQAGESRKASKTSTQDMSPQKRGGKRSGNRQGPGGPTRDQLYNEAKNRNIRGRSRMTKKQLQDALGR